MDPTNSKRMDRKTYESLKWQHSEQADGERRIKQMFRKVRAKVQSLKEQSEEESAKRTKYTNNRFHLPNLAGRFDADEILWRDACADQALLKEGCELWLSERWPSQDLCGFISQLIVYCEYRNFKNQIHRDRESHKPCIILRNILDIPKTGEPDTSCNPYRSRRLLNSLSGDRQSYLKWILSPQATKIEKLIFWGVAGGILNGIDF